MGACLMQRLKGWLHEGSHWLVGRLLGETCDVAIYLKPNGRLDYPFMCIWKRNRIEMPMWKQWLICAAPYFMFGPFMFHKGMGWNVFEYIWLELE